MNTGLSHCFIRCQQCAVLSNFLIAMWIRSVFLFAAVGFGHNQPGTMLPDRPNRCPGNHRKAAAAMEPECESRSKPACTPFQSCRPVAIICFRMEAKLEILITVSPFPFCPA